MFFKYLMIAAIAVCVLGFLYGDHIFKFQADLMMNWMYGVPAYEAYERIVLYYPKSKFRTEAEKMMQALYKNNTDVRLYINERDKGTRGKEKDRRDKERFH